MITIFELKFQSSEKLRKKLGIFGSKWAEKLDIKDLLRIAFPESTDTEIKANLKYFIDHGTFKQSPVSPKVMHANYCHEFGYSLPFDANGYEEPQVTKPKVEAMEIKTQQNDEMSKIKQMLLDELAIIQDSKNYTTQDGSIDTKKAELLFKRAETVNNIAGSLVALALLHWTEDQIAEYELKVLNTKNNVIQ